MNKEVAHMATADIVLAGAKIRTLDPARPGPTPQPSRCGTG